MSKLWKNGIIILISVCILQASNFAQAKPTNKQLTIGISQEFDTLNSIISQMGATRYMAGMFARPLTAINADWNDQCYLCVKIPTFKNGLAKKFTDKDGKEKIIATWEIHPNAKWGDGTPVTGHDFKFSWKVGTTNNISVGEREVYAQIEAITVDKTNPKRFSLKYAEAKYNFNQLHTFFIIPKHIEEAVFNKSKHEIGLYEKQTTYSSNPSNPGLYMGPYIVKDLKLSSHVVLEANPHWFGKQPKIKKIVIKYIPNTQALEANLRAGTVDMVSEMSIALDQALAIQKQAKPSDVFKVKFREGTVYEHVDLNLRSELLKDVRVRRALVHAIDRDKLTKALFAGKQNPAIHNISRNDPYFTEDVVIYPYDIKRAAALLDEAGWKLGKDNVRAKDGKKLTLVLMTTAQNKTRELVEVFLQNQWKAVGINIEIKNEPARVFFGETVRKAKYPHMALYAWISHPGNPPKSMLHSINIPSKANGFAGQNSGGWANKKTDKLLDEVYKEFTLEGRKKKMQKVLYEYTNDVPVIPLYYRSEIAIIPKNMQGHRITAHQFYSTLAAEYWELKE